MPAFRMVNANLRVRAAEPGDAAAVASLAEQLGYPAAAGEITLRLDSLRRRSDHAVLVAEHEGAVVGGGHVGVEERVESPPRAVIGGLVVEAALRRHRIGERLLEAAGAGRRHGDAPRCGSAPT